MHTQDEITKEENDLRDKIQELSDDNKKIFFSQIEKEIKDPDTCAVLNWLFIAGLHHFYLKKYLKGSINLSVFLLGSTLSFFDDTTFGIGIGMLVSLFIVELFQLFKSQLILQDYNNMVTKRLLGELEA